MTYLEIPGTTSEQGPFRIGLVVLPDCNLLSIAAALDPFRAANRRAGRGLYDWQVMSPEGGALRLTSGLEIATAPLPLQIEADLVILVAGFRLDTHATPSLRAWLRQLRARAIRYCGVPRRGSFANDPYVARGCSNPPIPPIPRRGASRSARPPPTMPPNPTRQATHMSHPAGGRSRTTRTWLGVVAIPPSPPFPVGALREA
ncbi:MAG: hypothetical protein R6U99_01565, partial [Nioella sp.]